MCGITGFVSFRPPSEGSDAVLQRMTEALRHRGPDSHGYYRHRPIGAALEVQLGHRRLSIVDAATGKQPMANEDRSCWLVYNGEIFNHRSVRPRLKAAGHRYATQSDTETILHAYEQYGASCVDHFRGVFAFALWDEKARTLFCARDRLGTKPFYYYWDGRLFVFASEVKALLLHPEISTRVDERLIPEYLNFGYLSGERTLFRGIRKLMPGHHLSLSVRPDGVAPVLRIERYWESPAPSSPESGAFRDVSDAEWIEQTRNHLEDAVESRLMSDVPLGVLLSGGLDSSSIAALAQRMTPGARLKTFAVGYEELAYSELGYAAQVAQGLGTDHHQVLVSRNSFFDVLPRLIFQEDEPVSWSSSVALYFLSELAAKQVKVILSGEGSDELFAGYERYRWHLLNQSGAHLYRGLPVALRRRIRRAVTTSRLLAPSLRRKLGHTFVGREESLESLLLDNFYCAFTPAEVRRLMGRLLSSKTGALYEGYLGHWRARESASILERMLYADQQTYLVELLMRQDQVSMAWSVESRVPFLDHRLVELSTRIPDRLKINRGVQKYILKKAVEDLLPRRVIHRRKMGFPTPLKAWLRGPGAEPLLRRVTQPDGILAAYLDRSELNRLVDDHRRGRFDGTERIWRLLNLQLWGELFIDGGKGSNRLRDPAQPLSSA